MQQPSIIIQRVSTIIDEYLSAKGSVAMRYAALPAGKCLRASLFIGTAQELKIVDSTTLHIAAAIELIHSFSLVHDDLPALDNDSMRRGKPSCHVVFGEAEAILTGNALLMLAFEIIGQYAPVLTADTAQFVNLMIEGQRHDMNWQNSHHNDIQKIIHLYALKTGALFVLALKLAVKLAALPTNTYELIETYGYNLGVGFQVQDDLADNGEYNLQNILSIQEMEKLILEKKHHTIIAAQKLKIPFLRDFADHVLQCK